MLVAAPHTCSVCPRLPLLRSQQLECTVCPGAGYRLAKHAPAEGPLTLHNTPTLSNCVWQYTVLSRSIPTSKPNLYIRGSYTGTCQLQEDTGKGCQLPESCDEATVAVQGVIYLVKQAVRVGPSDQAIIAPDCPLQSDTPGCRTDSAASGSEKCRSTRRSVQQTSTGGHSLPTGKGKPHMMIHPLMAHVVMITIII